MNSVLVSVASQGRENYNKAQLSLIKSAVSKYNGDYRIHSVDGYCNNYLGVPITLGGWPVTEKYGVAWQHKDMPYQFKPFAIQAAREAGYTRILWCDSTIRIMKDPYPLWEQCAKHGILAWNNEGHPLKDWISNYAVGMLQCDVSDMKQIMACCIMFDFDHPKTQGIFDAWIDGSIEGGFQDHPAPKAHRHDQAYLSALLQMNDVEIQPYGELAYPHYTPIDPTFLNYGIG